MASLHEINLALQRSLLKGKIESMFDVEDVSDLNDDLVITHAPFPCFFHAACQIRKSLNP